MTFIVLIECIIIGIFLLGSWFFSGFESGIISINRHRLVYLIRHGNKGAKRIARILRDAHRMLATTLVGNNICNIVLSTLSAQLGYGIAEEAGQSIATFLTGILVLIFGELFPKLWFTSQPLTRSIQVAKIFSLMQTILYPLASICLFITHRISGVANDKRSPFISRENLNVIAQDSEAHGTISAFERLMIKQVMNLQVHRVTEIMTPLSHVARVYESDNITTCLRVFRQSHHTRLPLFSDDDSRCIGLLYLSDLLHTDPAPTDPKRLARPVAFIPRETPADEILPLMRKRRQKLLVVKSEHGKIAGIVTQEAVLHAVIDDELLQSSTQRRKHKPKHNPETHL